MADEKTRPYQMRVTEEWLSVIDDWRRAQSGIPSRAEAIRNLVNIGLESEPILKELIEFLERIGDPADEETRVLLARLRGIVSSPEAK